MVRCSIPEEDLCTCKPQIQKIHAKIFTVTRRGSCLHGLVSGIVRLNLQAGLYEVNLQSSSFRFLQLSEKQPVVV
jgi:hypothetical protein